LRTTNGTFVLRAACATVTNCSASLKSAAAISRRVPGLSTDFTRSRSSGSHTETAIVWIVLGALFTATMSSARDEDDFARGIRGLAFTAAAAAGSDR
jgi:hypothetical protein